MRRYKPYRYKRKRSGLMSTNAGPILMFFGTILAILAALYGIVFHLLPWALPTVLGVEFRAPFAPTPTPVVTPLPTPTPHQLTTIDPAVLQREIMPAVGKDSALRSYPWFGDDPYAFGDKIIFTLGKMEEGQPCMTQLYEFDKTAQAYQKINVTIENQSLFSPVFNDRWLVYLDAFVEGGGLIKARSQTTGAAKTVKQYYAGMPKLRLVGDRLIWIERTGSRMDKLFVCDLPSLETAVIEMFENSQYGMSWASACDEEIIWANLDPAQGAEEALSDPHGAIYSLEWGNKPQLFTPGVYIHDPLTNGQQWIWIDSNHTPDAKLYTWAGLSAPKLIESGVSGYGLGENFLAYGKDQAVWVYFYDLGTRHKITPDRESAQFLDVSGNTVFWMDVTTRERDVLKYATVGEETDDGAESPTQPPAGT